MSGINISTIGIAGSDGHTPVYDPSGRWTIWNLNEIYLGTTGLRKYVPKVNDYVIETVGLHFSTYLVTDINPITLIPELSRIDPTGLNVSTEDILTGYGDGNLRVYVDKSVYPYTLCVDSRYMVPGSDAKYARLYKGTITSDTIPDSEIISRLYNNSGDFLGHDVQLEMVALDTHDNFAIKSVPVCNTVSDLINGERVTIIIFDLKGHVLDKRILLVENTSYVRQAYTSQKFITSISLETPFVSPENDNNIMFPVNMPIQSLGISGVVHYNDGSTLTLPVNGTKFSLHGLDQFVSTIEGQEVPLVLRYSISEGEATYGAVTSDSKYITKPYKLIVTEPKNSYNIKLNCYPEWHGETVGYKLNFILTNLDRNVSIDVSNFVTFEEITGYYDPKLYGYLQRKQVRIDMTKVSSYFLPFVHTQLIDIMLREKPFNTENPWEVSSESATQAPLYGYGLYVNRDLVNPNFFKIDSGIVNVDEWVDRVYYRTQPLRDITREIKAPYPTHIKLKYMDNETILTLDQFKDSLNLNTVIPIHKNLTIIFLKETYAGYSVLGAAQITVMQ